jgi:hypothetical protein
MAGLNDVAAARLASHAPRNSLRKLRRFEPLVAQMVRVPNAINNVQYPERFGSLVKTNSEDRHSP